MYQLKKLNNPRYALKYLALDFTLITKFIDFHVVGNKLVDFLPRSLIYPSVKYINYFEFLIQKLFKKNQLNNLFAMKAVGVKRVNYKELEFLKSSKQKSLRGIVNSIEKNEKVINFIGFDDSARKLLGKGL